MEEIKEAFKSPLGSWHNHVKLINGCLLMEAPKDLQGILQGLKVVAEHQMDNGELESDSEAAIKEGPVPNAAYLSLVGECKSLLAKLGISIMHALIEGNKVANKLSQEGFARV
ncbi:hypothetical protein Vadar_025739 [Vaccinium darrowii]|uniref:Uncharacterized protein n=1 Tax=Vaccinium darrowii TaxID=229202 RepID=A0ACB7Y300_9ERIC|nr:hypothetical protein Vadar_025739 [Vaccinium darrowii]